MWQGGPLAHVRLCYAPGLPVSVAEQDAIIRQHVELIQTLLPERLALAQVKKHLAWYSRGLPRAAETRPLLFQAPDVAAALGLFLRLR